MHKAYGFQSTRKNDGSLKFLNITIEIIEIDSVTKILFFYAQTHLKVQKFVCAFRLSIYDEKLHLAMLQFCRFMVLIFTPDIFF